MESRVLDDFSDESGYCRHCVKKTRINDDSFNPIQGIHHVISGKDTDTFTFVTLEAVDN